MRMERQLTPGVVNGDIFWRRMAPDAKKKQGKNGEKQHAGLLYSMGCSKTVTQKKDGYCCNAP